MESFLNLTERMKSIWRIWTTILRPNGTIWIWIHSFPPQFPFLPRPCHYCNFNWFFIPLHFLSLLNLLNSVRFSSRSFKHPHPLPIISYPRSPPKLDYLDLENLADVLSVINEHSFQLEEFEDFLPDLITTTVEKKNSAKDNKKEKGMQGKGACRPLLRKTEQEKRDEVNKRERNRNRAFARWKEVPTEFRLHNFGLNRAILRLFQEAWIYLVVIFHMEVGVWNPVGKFLHFLLYFLLYNIVCIAFV